MKAVIASVLLVVVAVGQEHRSQHDSDNTFQLEQPFKHPVSLPASVLNVLRADRSNRDAFETCPSRGKLEEIPANWFVAAKIDLKHGERPGLILRADNGCLWGANIGPFWVFRHNAGRYELILEINTLALEFLNRRTNGFRDVRASAASATQVFETVYQFRAGEYRVAATAEKTSP